MFQNQLRAFHAVAKSGSFTGAADELSVTQPAISDQIRKLEQAYGTPLFIRHARGVAMTETGRKLFALTEKSAETEQEVLNLLSQSKKLETGQLTIGADAAAHVMPLLKRFSARYPGVSVRLVSGNSASLVERLQAFEIDFAMVGRVPDVPGLVAHRISNDPMMAVVAAHSALAKRKSVTLKELARGPLIMREQGSHTRDLVAGALQKQGLAWTLALEVEGREACFEAVAQGLGAAIVSAGELPHDRRIKALAISDRVEPMSEWLVHLKARTNLRLIQSLVALVSEPR
ncbi:LysR substrate-binding domain-containing protein [Aestuariivirga litoralis]|uniref:LysR substrate-binding domain-containing protein n=1 Tax=Aestuariivirga litoralis TaxID=2650924 RepID=UPI0018C7507A|nr:LysR substrate-binding domain-containing protein [Aestuariivirga litoralis]MBG1232043.1 LysR family transcriptional regulator [Aestuariivirga litoralis]